MNSDFVTSTDPFAVFAEWLKEAEAGEPNDPNAMSLATVAPVSPAEADAYYDSRPRGSRIGAWASQQSRPLESRFALEKAVATYTAKFGIGGIPRPSYWSGFRLTPVEIEFWHDRPFRLHDRVSFRRGSPTEPWSKTRLYP